MFSFNNLVLFIALTKDNIIGNPSGTAIITIVTANIIVSITNKKILNEVIPPCLDNAK